MKAKDRVIQNLMDRWEKMYEESDKFAKHRMEKIEDQISIYEKSL